MVHSTVYVLHGLWNIAFTTAIDNPARVNTRINKTVMDAIKPDLSPNNSVAITEILLPLCLTDAKELPYHGQHQLKPHQLLSIIHQVNNQTELQAQDQEEDLLPL